MYYTSSLVTALVVAATAYAQSSSLASSAAASSADIRSTSSSGVTSFNLASASTITNPSVAVPTGRYQSFASQIILTGSSSRPSNATIRPNNSTTTRTSTSSNTLLLQGTNRPASTTNSAARPSNTQACNGDPSYCNKRYMNITQVCAHNSAFDIRNNAASNQMYGITSQLNDGVRMIQGETHYFDNTIYSCHTSCDLLNAGTLQSNLQEVAAWVSKHPYDVVTILIVNSDYRNITDYISPIQNSGLAPYLYTPPKIPMLRDDWPTYGDIILSGKRVVIFMDYNADQTLVPYVLDEFSQMWETPFSPTDRAFPCTQQRPPGLNRTQQDQRPYLANHNLNLELSIAGQSLLIPAYGQLTEINAVSGNSSAGLMLEQCKEMWNRPPAWLLVDYYNYGLWNGQNDTGAVFEAAARMNGVNYTRPCCGPSVNAASQRGVSSLFGFIAALVVSMLMIA